MKKLGSKTIFYLVGYTLPVNDLINFLEEKSTNLTYSDKDINKVKEQKTISDILNDNTPENTTNLNKKVRALKRLKANLISYFKNDEHPFQYALDILYKTTIFSLLIGSFDIITISLFKETLGMDIILSILLTSIFLFILAIIFFLLTMRVSIVPRIQKMQNQDVAISAIDEIIEELNDKINNRAEKTDTGVNDKILIDILNSQLDKKDKQIETMQIFLNQHQQLALQTNRQIQHLQLEETKETEKGFFSSWFRS